MKMTVPLLAASVIAIVAGVFLKPVSKLACVCLIFAGLIALFTVLGYAALVRMPKRCPACGQQIHVSPGQHSRIHNGMIACPRCGVLVRVDHVTPR